MKYLIFKREIIDKCHYDKERADVGWYERLCIDRQYGLQIVEAHEYDIKLFSDPIDFKSIVGAALTEKGDFAFKPRGHIKLSMEDILCDTFDVSPDKVKEVFNKVDKKLQ